LGLFHLLKPQTPDGRARDGSPPVEMQTVLDPLDPDHRT